MTMLLQTPPPGAQAAIAALVDGPMLAQLAESHRPIQDALTAEAALTSQDSAAPDSLDLAAPHPVYFLALSDLRDGKGMEAARATGWRWLVIQNAEVVGSASVVPEVSLDAENRSGAEYAFADFSEGPFPASMNEALLALEGNAALAESDYEVRLLEIPGLYVVALWLARLKGAAGQDYIMPLTPAPEPFRAQALEARDVFEHLAKLAASEKPDFDSSPREEP